MFRLIFFVVALALAMPRAYGQNHQTDLVKLLGELTAGIPEGSVITWSNIPLAEKLGRQIGGGEVAGALAHLGLIPLSRYLSRPPESWSYSQNLDCVFHFLADTEGKNIPVYSITRVYQPRDSGKISMHGAELRLMEAYSREIKWIDPADSKSLEAVRDRTFKDEILAGILADQDHKDVAREVIGPVMSEHCTKARADFRKYELSRLVGPQ